MEKSKKTTEYDVKPSDIGQALVRVLLVSGVVMWSWVNAGAGTLIDSLQYPFVRLSISYWLFSCLLLVWTYRFLPNKHPSSHIVVISRSVGILTDLGAISAYTAISGEYGTILYPVYLTCVIGYGYRFGIRYLHLSILTAAVFMSVALSLNQAISSNQSLVVAYYLGLFLVPLYSSALLRKHREVLERLREVNAARSRFIANVSHELRTPLHAIISVTDVLTEEAMTTKASGNEQLMKLSLVGDSAKHLLELVNRILDVAAAESGRRCSVDRETVDLMDVAITTLRMCGPEAAKKGIGFYWHVSPRLPRFVLSSRARLEEILINTIGNAVKYTQTGYVNVNFTLRRSDDDSEMIHVTISDTGIGISEKLLPNIFEPFTLGDDSADRKYPGTGLGLTITKQCLDILGGDIAYDSAEGVGTRCAIQFPAERVHAGLTKRGNGPNPKCLLLAQRRVSPTETSAIEVAGFDCKVTTKLDFEFTLQSVSSVILIDESFDGLSLAVMEALKKKNPNCLIVRYGRSFDGRGGTEAMHLNSLVRIGEPSDLHCIRALCDVIEKKVQGDLYAAHPAEGTVKRVLVADDNSLNQRTAILALESVGHKVTVTANGEDALTELEKGIYDIALFDMHMPLMSGVEAAKIYQFINAHEEPTPIVILTADVTAGARESAADAGVAGFLTKPVGARELRDAVERLSKSTRSHGIDPDYAATRSIATATRSREASEQTTVSFSEIQELLELGIDPEDIRQMIVEFAVEAREIVTHAQDSVTFSKWEDLDSLMHSLKGSAATVGAIHLSQVALNIQENCVSRDRSIDFELVAELLPLLERSENMLCRYIDERVQT